MSEARSGIKPADLEHELDEIADELYALRPDEFAGARDERAREAKTAGRPELARELAKLRKPTQSAWLINLLWRDQRDVMEQLLELGEELRDAQAKASGPALHQLTAVRRQLEAGMIRQAHALAEKAGVSVSASMEREAQETLAAALARPDVADEVRTGRLVKPATYAGFGDMGSVSTAATDARHAAKADKDVKKEHSAGAGPAKIDRIEDRAAQRARERREAAERRVAEARSAVEAAADALAQVDRNAEAAQERQKTAHEQADKLQEQVRELQERLAELQERLREVKVEQVAAEQAIQATARRRDQADKAHETAQRTLDAAEKDLQDLPTA